MVFLGLLCSASGMCLNVQVGILFYIAAAAYGPLTSKGGLGTFQFIYFFSSFWGQFGPNCTTFLLAGECKAVTEGCYLRTDASSPDSMCQPSFSAWLKLL